MENRIPLIKEKVNPIGMIKYIITAIFDKNPTLKIEKTASFNDAEFISFLSKENLIFKKNIKLSGDKLLSIIQDCNIEGNGGAGFSLYKKLKTFIDSVVDNKIIIINAVECDPGLIHDRWILKNKLNEVIKGIEIIKQITHNTKVILAHKDVDFNNKTEDFKTVCMPDYYPAGYEKRLIKEVLNTKLSKKSIPAQEGILVLNIQTILNLYNELYIENLKKQQYFTLVNLKNKKSHIVLAEVGASLLEISKKLYPNEKDIYVGGGAMQVRPLSVNDKLQSKNNFIGIGKATKFSMDNNCHKCGKCTVYCPAKLYVKKLVAYNKDGIKYDKEDERFNVERCISCGSCSYLCPAKIDLCSFIQKGVS